MLEEIKENYAKLTHKLAFVEVVAFKFGNSAEYIERKWFGRNGKIPKELEPKILQMSKLQSQYDETERNNREEFTRNL